MDTARLFGHYVQVRTLLLALAQAALAVVGMYLAAELLRQTVSPTEGAPGSVLLLQAVLFACVLVISMYSLGLYQVQLRHSRREILVRVALGCGLGLMVLAGVSSLFPAVNPGQQVLGASVLFALVAFSVSHIGFFQIVDRGALKRRVLFFGAGRNAAALLSRLRRRSDRRLFMLVGCVGLPDDAEAIDPASLVRTNESLLDYVRARDVDEVVVTLDDRRGRFPAEQLLECRLAGVEVRHMLSFYERHTGRLKCELMRPGDIIFAEGFHRGAMRGAAKRGLDVAVASLGLALSSPLMAVAALAIKLEDGWRAPVFYRQVRVGLGGAEYEMLKMRSMRVDAEREGKAQWASTDDARITRVGSVLRKYRIDELPQLLNILRGEMSLVGPRPERPEFVATLSRELPFYAVRHSVKPGITGWAQLCYPYGASSEDALQKLEYDLYYVKNCSIFLDLLILLGTVEIILFGKGAR